MTAEYTQRLLSSDSHIVEPADLWTTRMDKKWRDKAPRIEALDETGDYIVIDGQGKPLGSTQLLRSSPRRPSCAIARADSHSTITARTRRTHDAD